MISSLNMRLCLLLGLFVVVLSSPLPWDSECRQTVDNWGGMGATEWKLSANIKCDEGVVDWHYPRSPESLEVFWTRPSSYGAFKVCLQPESISFAFSEILDLNNNKQIANPENWRRGDEQPASSEDSCATSVNGEVKMLFKADDWTYMQSISYKIFKS